MFIYLIVNHETGKYYVGQHKGTNLKKYLQDKLSAAKRNTSQHSYLYNSMRKHPNHTSWSIHALRSDIQTKPELDETEQDFIKFLKAQDSEYGYNICRGGEGRTGPLSQEARKKTGRASKEMWKQGRGKFPTIPPVFKGPHSLESRNKMSVSQYKRFKENPLSVEHIQRLRLLSISRRGVKRPDSVRKLISQKTMGRTYSPETLERMKEGQQRRFSQQPVSEETKRKQSVSASLRIKTIGFTDEHRKRISEGQSRRWATVRAAMPTDN
jgi:hypothetical protein